jgi:hypothetical protein
VSSLAGFHSLEGKPKVKSIKEIKVALFLIKYFKVQNSAKLTFLFCFVFWQYWGLNQSLMPDSQGAAT